MEVLERPNNRATDGHAEGIMGERPARMPPATATTTATSTPTAHAPRSERQSRGHWWRRLLQAICLLVGLAYVVNAAWNVVRLGRHDPSRLLDWSQLVPALTLPAPFGAAASVPAGIEGLSAAGFVLVCLLAALLARTPVVSAPPAPERLPQAQSPLRAPEPPVSDPPSSLPPPSTPSTPSTLPMPPTLPTLPPAPASLAALSADDAPGEAAVSGFVPRVFISHSSADNAFGLDLERRLKAELGEPEVFYDADGGLIGGDAWLKRLQHEITERNVFVLLLSPQAFASQWVDQELSLALRQAVAVGGKVIIPVLQQETDTWPFLQNFQTVNFVKNPYNQAFTDLMIAIRLGASRRADLAGMRLERAGPPYDVDLLPVVDRFIGRTDALQWMLDRLDAPTPDSGGLASIAAANGLAGIGKSALAGQVARILYATNRFPDGIAVVLCNGLTDPSTVLRRILARFDPLKREPQETDLDPLRDLARQVFGGRRALVVLDNVEAGWPVEQVVKTLRVSGVAVLLTSRVRLPASAVPATESRMLELLTPTEAVDLFAEYVGRGSAQGLTMAEQSAAGRIAQALGFHTLAVKLAAARAQGRDLEAVARAYEADPRLGIHLKEGTEAVEVVLQSSVEALPAQARTLFAALAAFATLDLGRQAVLSVAAALEDPDPEDSLAAMLDLRLVDAYVSDVLPADADRERLRVHPLVGAYAAQRLAAGYADDARRAMQVAVATWYAHYADSVPDLALIADEGNVAGAIEWAHAHDESAAVAALCDAMQGFWHHLDRTASSLRYLTWGIAAADAIGPDDDREAKRRRARLRSFFGSALNITGQLDAAKRYFQQALAIRREVQDRQGEGIDLNSLGQVAQRRGQLDAAERYYQESLAIHRDVQDRQGEGLVLSNLGQVAQRRGQLDAAERYYQESLAIRREVQDRQGEGAVLSNLGQVAQQRGQLDDAERYFQQSLAILREVQDRQGEGIDLAWLAQVALSRSRLEQAETYWKQALAISEEIEDRGGKGSDLHNLGQVAQQRGQLDAAEGYFQQSLAIRREVQDRQGEGAVLGSLGQVAQRRGQLDDAERYFQQSLAIRREVQDRRGEGIDLAYLGLLAQEREEWEAAAGWYRQGIAAVRDTQDAANIASIARALGELLIEHLDQREEGCDLLQTAVQIYQRMGLVDEAAHTESRAQELGCIQ